MTNTSDIAIWGAVKSNPSLALTACGMGLLIAFLFFKLFFEDWSDFWECVKFWFTPDWISMLRGEWLDDRWNTMKLFVWIGLLVGSTFFAYYQLPDWFPNLFHRSMTAQ
jgi:hypothetical protein